MIHPAGCPNRNHFQAFFTSFLNQLHPSKLRARLFPEGQLLLISWTTSSLSLVFPSLLDSEAPDPIEDIFKLSSNKDRGLADSLSLVFFNLTLALRLGF